MGTFLLAVTLIWAGNSPKISTSYFQSLKDCELAGKQLVESLKKLPDFKEVNGSVTCSEEGKVLSTIFQANPQEEILSNPPTTSRQGSCTEEDYHINKNSSYSPAYYKISSPTETCADGSPRDYCHGCPEDK